MEYTDKDKALRYAAAEWKAQLKDGSDTSTEPDGVVVIESRGKFHVEAGDGGLVRNFERIIWRNGQPV